MIYNNNSADLGVCAHCMLMPMLLIADKHYPTLLLVYNCVSNVHHKFKSCTVVEKAATMI